MSEGKPVDPVEKMFKECGIPVKMVDCTSPPTDSKRPDIEGIRSYAGVVMEIRSTTGMKGKAGRIYLDRVLPSIIPLCDHTLAVEKERDTLKAKLEEALGVIFAAGQAHALVMLAKDKADSPSSTDPKRPDVEGIRQAAKDLNGEVWAKMMESMEKVCDHTLELEKRLKMAETDRVAMKEINQECYNTLRSLLADLVEAGGAFEVIAKKLSDHIPNDEEELIFIKVVSIKRIATALTAAKQHLKAAKTVLEEKSK